MSKLVDYRLDSYHKNRHNEFLNSEKLLLAWSEFAHIEYFNGLSAIDIFEFGGAMGYNLIHLAKSSNVFMIEPSEIGREYAKRYGIKTAKDIEEICKVHPGCFDIVFCRHVLEHLENPLETLKELKSLLKAGGSLILVLPVEKSSNPVKDEIDFHLYCWTPRTAINLLKTAGFTSSIIWNYNYFTGKRIFLPFYSFFGVKVYRSLMKLLGRAFNAKELVIKAFI